MEKDLKSEPPRTETSGGADDLEGHPARPPLTGDGASARPSGPLDPMVLAEIRTLDSSGALLRTAFGIFFEDGPRLLRELKAAFAQQDREAFTFASHTLKSCAGSVGAFRVARACGALEHAARQGEPLGPASALDELGGHLREAITAMTEECGLPPAQPLEDRG